MQQFSKLINPWLIAIRPKTLTAGLAPIILATALSISAGFFNLRIITMVIIATVAIQIATNLINDYYDYIKGIDDIHRKGFTKVLVEKMISLQAMRKGILTILSIATLSSTYLILKGGWPVAIIALLSILMAFAYSAGPFPLSHTGFAEIVEMIFFGPIAVTGTFYLLTKTYPLYVVIAGLIPGFLSLAILTIDNLRDYETDFAKGKKTLCVRLGVPFTQLQYYFCIFMGFTLPVLLVYIKKSHYFSLVSLLLFPFYIPCIQAVKNNKGSEELNLALKQTASTLLLFVIAFSWGWMF